ncbi:M4 family metallopeptidase [Paludisphaera rhizosphaerae]|uniref:M4 family metallopeptidase n=1 Tax=Paludisphaera rhizosphaerae TaxID=2711216 RepID=UPI0013EA1AC1|nr:M4 family metallopeptidase [Paludisphaera rhizosphaerae]
MHRFAFAASLISAIAFGCVVSAEDNPDVKAGTGLLKEGDDLADKGQPNEAQIRYKEAFEKILPKLRGIPFRHEVKRDVTKREKMQEMLLKEFEADMTPAEFEAQEKTYKAFGMIPADMDLKKLLVDVYSEEIAAYYDPKTKTMYMIEEPEEQRNKPPTFLEKFLGKTGGFDKDENKTVIAHEMTHALSDQHFDLDALHEASKKNDDHSMAVSALIEGEATLAMMAAGQDDWDGSQIVKTPAEALGRTMEFMAPFLTSLGGGKSLKNAPPIISDSMLFPYLRGLVYCARLANDDGWKGIDAAYLDPPLSTEQILHPSKYRAKPDYPTLVDLGAISPGDGWKEIARNVMGEMQTAVMLKRHGGGPAAAGWDGDRYAVFEGPDAKLGLVWMTTWDSEDDAQQFAEAYARYQTSRMGDKKFQPVEVPRSLWRAVDDVTWIVDRRGSDVVVVEGFPPSTSSPLVESAFKSAKTEMKPTPREPKPAVPEPAH